MKKKNYALKSALLVPIVVLGTGCVSMPSRSVLPETTSLPPARTGALHRSFERIAADLDPGESAFWLLDHAGFSYEARLALVDQAVECLDIQYFIWEKDPTSALFSERVLQAADRGVRVRILLDDLTLNGQDGEFRALAEHPNVTVRTFNPWNARHNIGRVTEGLLRFGLLNHRMHNKTVIADGHFAILGGRNIGDRYFGVWEEFVQNDLDIMGAGPIAADVAASFDLYWNSDLTYTLDDVITKRAARQTLAPTIEALRQKYTDAEEKLQEFPINRDSWDDLLTRISTDFSVGNGALWQDLPDVDEALPDQMVMPIFDMIASAKHRVLLSTAYLVPDDEFVAMLGELEERGVEVIILTNSLASNNHMVAHMAYKPWRKDLLALGIDLFEARADSRFISEYSVPPVEPEYLGLHSKAIVVDDRYSFVGSPNIDPRSLLINTEIGMFVDSEDLAARLTALLERDISPDAAWQVVQNERGRLRWVSSAGTMKKQPALGFMQRVAAFFINWLPLKSQA